MHRSGTSLVGQTLAKMGVPMGKALLEANEFNPRGYVEDIEAVRIHDMLLGAMGRPWGAASHALAFPSDWAQSAPAQKAAARVEQYLQARGGGIFGVKDPRISLFLPLWRAAAKRAGVQVKLILCHRPAPQVAASLAQRDGLVTAVGMQLWLQYNASAILAAPTGHSMVVFHADWRDQPGLNPDRIARFLGQGDAAPDLYEPRLDHHQHTSVDGLFARWAEAFDRVRSGKGQPDRALRTLARQWQESAGIFSAGRGAGGAGRLAHDISSYRRAHAALESKLSAIQNADPKHGPDADTSRSELEEVRQTLAETIEVSNDIQNELSSLGQSYAELEAERDTLLARAIANLEAYQTIDACNTAANEEIERQRQRLAEMDTSLSTQAAAHTAQLSRMTQLIEQLGEQKARSDKQWSEEQAGYETTIQVLGADVTRLQAENDSLQAQLEAQHRSLSQIKAHAQMLERQNAKLARWHLPSHLRRLGLGKIKKD
jgi:hypothetical protein